MPDPKLWQRLARKNVNHRRIATDVIRRPEWMDELVSGLEADRAPVRFGSAKVLQIVSERAPEILVPRIGLFIDLLDCDNRILRWNAILIVGNLAVVDSKRKIDRILDRYLEPIPGPELITAANTIRGATRIARARPRLVDRIVDRILTTEKGRYKTAECRNVVLGHAIDALDTLFDRTKRKERVARFVERQLRNPRNATRRRAERFAKRRLIA
jgi:hypothetical protein